MARFKVTLTVTFAKKVKSEEVSQVITAKDRVTAVSNMIAGIFSSRKGTTIWYREYQRKAFPQGYQKPEKRILIAAVREDVFADPEAGGYPTNFLHPKIKVEDLPDEPPPEPKKEPRKKPQQLLLFGSKYIAASGESVEVSPGLLDKSKLNELGKKKVKEPPLYAIFLRVLSEKGLKRVEEMRPPDPTPEENDSYQGFVNRLRDTDSWILSPEAPASKLPKSAVKSPITVSDLRGLTAIQRQVENAYVDGDVAYVEIDDAFSGAPPILQPQPQGM